MIPLRPSLRQVIAEVDPELDADAVVDATGSSMPWYGRVLAGGSAWIAATILCWAASTLGPELSPLFGPLAVLLLVGSTLTRRLDVDGGLRDFVLQGSLIGTLVGRGLAAVELFDHLSDPMAALAMAGIELALVVFYADRLQRFASTAMCAAWLNVALVQWDISAPWLPVVMAAVALAAWLTEPVAQGSAALRDVAAPVAYGAMTYSWLGLAVQLADGGLPSWVGPAMLALAVAASPLRGLASRKAASPSPDAPTSEGPAPSPQTVVAVLIVVALGLAMSTVAPGLPLAAVLLLLGFGRRDALLAGFATVGLIAWVVFFYYDLEMSLAQKGVLLIVSGVALWVAPRLVSRADGTRVLDATGSGPAPARRRSLVAIGLVAPLLVGGTTIVDLERTRLGGDPVLLELAPRDPRSLVQGDYMRLATRVERSAQRAATEVPERGDLVVRIDADGVGHFARFDDGTDLSADEHRLDYRTLHGRIAVGTRSFLFEEGTAELYEQARYGEYRVLPDGRSLLVGLRDGQRQSLGTPLAAW